MLLTELSEVTGIDSSIVVVVHCMILENCIELFCIRICLERFCFLRENLYPFSKKNQIGNEENSVKMSIKKKFFEFDLPEC